MELLDELQQIADSVHAEIEGLHVDELHTWLRENIQDVTVTRDCYNVPGLFEGYSVYLTGYNHPVRIETSDSQIEALEGMRNVRIHAITENLKDEIEAFIHDEISKL